MAMTDHPRRSVIAAVDDDQRILKSLEILLESADYDVRLFSCATALLERGGLREIDCLISGAARLATSLPFVQEAVQWAGTSHGRRRCSAEPAPAHGWVITSRDMGPGA